MNSVQPLYGQIQYLINNVRPDAMGSSTVIKQHTEASPQERARVRDNISVRTRSSLHNQLLVLNLKRNCTYGSDPTDHFG